MEIENILQAINLADYDNKSDKDTKLLVSLKDLVLLRKEIISLRETLSDDLNTMQVLREKIDKLHTQMLSFALAAPPQEQIQNVYTSLDTYT